MFGKTLLLLLLEQLLMVYVFLVVVLSSGVTDRVSTCDFSARSGHVTLRGTFTGPVFLC